MTLIKNLKRFVREYEGDQPHGKEFFLARSKRDIFGYYEPTIGVSAASQIGGMDKDLAKTILRVVEELKIPLKESELENWDTYKGNGWKLHFPSLFAGTDKARPETLHYRPAQLVIEDLARIIIADNRIAADWFTKYDDTPSHFVSMFATTYVTYMNTFFKDKETIREAIKVADKNADKVSDDIFHPEDRRWHHQKVFYDISPGVCLDVTLLRDNLDAAKKELYGVIEEVQSS
ncbi:MAG: hypothetical protein KC535_05025 [Nanoarchaeota archaeon]|nr:hypothetical protein [Nanoarchaeota archaeon]